MGNHGIVLENNGITIGELKYVKPKPCPIQRLKLGHTPMPSDVK